MLSLQSETETETETESYRDRDRELQRQRQRQRQRVTESETESYRDRERDREGGTKQTTDNTQIGRGIFAFSWNSFVDRMLKLEQLSYGNKITEDAV